MSQLSIVDLSFCESQRFGSNQVSGGVVIGVTIYSPSPTFPIFAGSSSRTVSSTDYFLEESYFFNDSSGTFGNESYFFDASTGTFGYVMATTSQYPNGSTSTSASYTVSTYETPVILS
ncbi:MAG: hypothetical protein LDL41_03115 [Coleofasciculus sp. S288]|nr:hypothetical protein [Coleofasciculus sp. S288]